MSSPNRTAAEALAKYLGIDDASRVASVVQALDAAFARGVHESIDAVRGYYAHGERAIVQRLLALLTLPPTTPPTNGERDG